MGRENRRCRPSELGMGDYCLACVKSAPFILLHHLPFFLSFLLPFSSIAVIVRLVLPQVGFKP